MPEEEQEHKQKKLWQASITNEALKSNMLIAALAMQGATFSQRLIVYICYGVISLGIILLSVPPYQSWKQILGIALIIAFLIIVLSCVVLRYKDLSKASPESVTPGDKQKPLTPTISKLKYQHLRTILQDTRKAACEFLKSKYPALSDNDVRVNIFFPEYDSSCKPDEYKLKIHPGLHLNMDRQQELLITFEPEQGVTGNVFASGQARVAKRLPSGIGDWDSVYNITDELATIIHPDLKWIMSMPLKSGGNRPTGVMNVDGLRQQLPIDILYECMGKLTNNVIIMSEVMMSS